MGDHFQEIYANRAAQYDAMVSREDYQGHLLPALHQIHPLQETVVVEFGAGTGRLTRLLVPYVRRIFAFDLSPHMLGVAQANLSPMRFDRWTLAAGDNRHMPVRTATADIAIAGWSFGHSMTWYSDQWEQALSAALGEMQRILRPGGTAIIIETLGTGSETPAPPNEHLRIYYDWLAAQGYAQTWIRTDYEFESVGEADQLTRFFFGDELADRILRESLLVLPECTGIWWRSY